MAKTVTRKLKFDAAERRRIAKCCEVLGIFFEEFGHDAIMQACDEMEGYARDLGYSRDT